MAPAGQNRGSGIHMSPMKVRVTVGRRLGEVVYWKLNTFNHLLNENNRKTVGRARPQVGHNGAQGKGRELLKWIKIQTLESGRHRIRIYICHI